MNAIIKYIFSTLFKKRETTSATGLRAALYDPVEDKFYWIDGASIGGGGGGGDLDPLVFPDNSVYTALKAYFAGDPDTGVYNPFPNQIEFVAGGQKQLKLEQSGGGPILTTSGGLVAASASLTGKLTAASASFPVATLVDGATITPAPNVNSHNKVTLGGNRTLAAPASSFEGTFLLKVIQDGTGSRTLTWNAVYKHPGGIVPTLSTTAGAYDWFTIIGNGSTYDVIPAGFGFA